jgi:hypothetical protein
MLWKTYLSTAHLLRTRETKPSPEKELARSGKRIVKCKMKSVGLFVCLAPLKIAGKSRLKQALAVSSLS